MKDRTSTLRQRREARASAPRERVRTSRFRLEGLEPRILLSADPLTQAVLLTVESQSNPAAPVILQDFSSDYKVTINIDGGSGVESTVQSDEASPNDPSIIELAQWSIEETGTASPLIDGVNAISETSSTSQENDGSSASTITLTGATFEESSSLSQSDTEVASLDGHVTWSEQLVETLHAANAPPLAPSLDSDSVSLAGSEEPNSLFLRAVDGFLEYSLTGSDGTFSRDLDSVTPGDQTSSLTAATRISVDLGGGDDTLSVHSSLIVALRAGGSISFQGGAGNDTLLGPGIDSEWSITGSGSGSVAGVAFAGIENLTGAADNRDTFTFTAAGSMAGLVDGGPGGFDTLVIDGGSYEHIAFTTTGLNSGTVRRDSNLIIYDGLEPIGDITTGPVRQYSGTGAGETITVSDSGAPGDGSFQITSTSGEGVQIVGTAGSILTLTIDLLGSNDAFVFVSIDTLFTGTITIHGGAGSDTFNAPDLAGVWHITGIDAGDYQATGGPKINFDGFENLNGAPTQADSFDFATDGAITGMITDGAGTLTVGIAGFVQVSGNYDFVQQSFTGSYSGGSVTNANVLTVGGTSGTGLIGVNAFDNPLGLQGTLTLFGLAVATDGTHAWKLFQGTIANPSFVGFGADFDTSLTNLTVTVNTGSGSTHLITSSAPISVATGSTPVSLNFSSNVIAASTTFSITIGDFVHLSGTFTFGLGLGASVNVKTGLNATTAATQAPSLTAVPVTDESGSITGRSADFTMLYRVPVAALTIAATDITVFVGYASGLNPTGPGGTLLKTDLPADAVGLYASNVDVGFVLMSHIPGDIVGLNALFLRFFALNVTAESFEILGIPELNVGADNLEVRANSGKTWLDPLITPATVDFISSFGPSGYSIPTGGTPISVKYTDNLLGASADRVLLRISDFVYVSGGFSFNKGPGKHVDVRTGLTTAQANTFFTGSTIPTGTDPADGTTLGRSSDGAWIWNLPVDTVEIGLTNVDVFVGYTDPSSTALQDAADLGELTKEALEAAGAVGALLDEASLGLVLMRALPVGLVAPQLDLARLRFFSLQADAGTMSLVGIDALDLSVTNLQVRVNQGSFVPAVWPAIPNVSPQPVVDFAHSFPDNSYDPHDLDSLADGYRVPTDTSGSYKALLFEQPVIGVSADRALLRISDFVYVSGGFSFNKGPVTKVDVRTGLNSSQASTFFAGSTIPVGVDPSNGTLARSSAGDWIWNLPVETLDVGLTNVDVFVGYTNRNSNVLEDAALGPTGELLESDLEAAEAIGVFLDEASLGLVAMRALPVGAVSPKLDLARLRFFSLQADAALVTLMGIDALDLSVTNLQVRVNQGSFVPAAWPAIPNVTPDPVVDFAHSFPDDYYDPDDVDTQADGYRVQTDTSGSYKALVFEQPVIGVSTDRALLRISDFVYVSGGFSFNKGPVTKVDVRTGLNSTDAATFFAGSTIPVGVDPLNGTLARSSAGDWIWNLPVETLDVGLTNVDVFVGYTNRNSNVLETAALGPTGELLESDLEAAEAIGVFLDEASLGLVAMRALPVGAVSPKLDLARLRFFSLQADAALVTLMGIDALDLSVTNLQVRVNQGSFTPPWPAIPNVTPQPVVDFAHSYPDNFYTPNDGDTLADGYRVQTDTSGSYKALVFEQPVVGVSADRALLRISDFVYVSGGFSFNKGPVTKVDVRTGLNSTDAATFFAGSTIPVGVDPSNGTLARSSDGAWIWNLPVETLDVGLTNVDVFVGYTNRNSNVLETAALGPTGELLNSDLEAAGAIGVFLDEASLGLVAMRALPVGAVSPKLDLARLRFFSLQADASLVTLMGIDALDLSVTNLQVRVNQGSFTPPWPAIPNVTPQPVVDFAHSYPDNFYTPNDGDTLADGYRVQTDTSGSYKALVFEQPVVGVSADRALLRISDFVYVSGGFSFNKGPVTKVDVRTGLNSTQATTFFTPSGIPISGDPSNGTLARSTDGDWIWNLPVETLDVGLTNVDVFVGYTDGDSNVLKNAAQTTGELTETDLEAVGAIGVLLDEASLGLVVMRALPVGALMSAKLDLARLRFFSLQADASLVTLMGIDGFDLSVTNLQVRVNQGSFVPAAWPAIPNVTPEPVVDFAHSYPDNFYTPNDVDSLPDGYHVQTDTSGSFKALLFEQPVIGVSADRALIRISDFVYVSGGFSFNKGPVTKVDVRTGLNTTQAATFFTPSTIPISDDPSNGTLARSTDGDWIWNLPVQTLDIGLTNVDVFVGYTDRNSNALKDAAKTGTGELLEADLEAAGAIGVFLDEASFGLVMMRALPVGPLVSAKLDLAMLRFLSLQADAAIVELMGIDDLDLSLDNLQVRINQGSFVPAAWPAIPNITPQPVVDFKHSYPDDSYTPHDGDAEADGYRVQTDTSGSYKALLFEQPVVGVSTDRALLRISDFVYVSGGFSFNKGPVKPVDVRTGLNSSQALSFFATSTIPISGDPSDGSLARSTAGDWIWNLPVETLEIGLTHVDVFVGYTDSHSDALETAALAGDLTEEALEAAAAIGVFLNDASLGLVVMRALPVGALVSAQLDLAQLRFFSLQADASLVTLMGIDELDLSVTNLQVRVNQGSFVPAAWPALPNITPQPVVDFAHTFPDNYYDPHDGDSLADGYRVPTDTSGSYKALVFDQPVIGASADNVLLRISDFVYVSGGFSFNKGPVKPVDVRTGLGLVEATAFFAASTIPIGNDPTNGTLARSADGAWIWNLPVETLDIGLSNVDVFVGYTDSGSNALETAAHLTGELTVGDLATAHAIGLFLDEVNLGLAVMRALPVGPLVSAPLDAAMLKFFAVQANALNLQLVGIPEIILSAFKAEVRLNQGSFVPAAWPALPGAPPPVVDFAHSFPDDYYDPDDADSLADGYRVPTNTSGAFIPLTFDQPLIAGGAEKVTIQLSEFVYLTGSIYFEKGPVIDAPLVAGLAGDLSGLGIPHPFDGTANKSIQTLTIGATGVHGFVGLDGPYWVDSPSGPNHNGLIDRDVDGNIIATEVNPEAKGLVIDDLNVGLFIGTPSFAADPVRYLALKASAQTIRLVGIDQITATADGIEIELNISSPTASGFPVLPVIDFSGLPGNKFGVKTGVKDINGDDVTIDLTMDTPLIRAQGFIDLRILDNIFLSGNIAFELGPTEEVLLTNGDSKTVTTMSIGAGDVTAFIGANGPYWTDLDSDHEVSWAFNTGSGNTASRTISAGTVVVGGTTYNSSPGTNILPTNTIVHLGKDALLTVGGKQWGDANNDDVIDVGESQEVSGDAIGFEITDFDMGLLLMASIVPLDVGVYLAAKASVNSFGLVGIDVIDATGTFDIEINVGLGMTSGAAVVNFLTSFPVETGHPVAGYSVNTGPNSPDVLLDFTEFLISIQLGGAVTIYTSPAQTQAVVRLNGLLLFEASTSGLKAFVAAGVEFGPDIGSSNKFFDLNALGALVINSDGIAADIDLSVQMGAALPGLTLVSSGARARLVFNTTGVNQDITIPARYVRFLDGTVNLATSSLGADLAAQGGANIAKLSSLTGPLDSRFTHNADGSATFTIFGTAPTLAALFPNSTVPTGGLLSAPGPYFAIAISANIKVLGNWGMDGRFGLIVSGSGFQLTVEANLMLGPVGSMSAQGDIIIDSTGLRARIAVAGTLGSASIDLEIVASGVFEINTTGSPWVINSSTTVNPGVRVGVNAHFDFLGFAEGNGTAVVVFENSNFQLVIDGDLTIGGVITFDIFAYVGIFAGDGVVIDIAVSLDIDNVLNLLDLNLSGRLQINTTNAIKTNYTGAIFDSSGHITGFGLVNFATPLAAHSFVLDLSGSLVLLDSLTISGRIIIAVANDAWSITVPASNPLTVNVFNVFSVQIWGTINSNGTFSLDLRGFVDFTLAGNGIRGTINLHLHLDPALNPDFQFTASGSVGAFLGGTELVGASVTLDARGNLGQSVNISLTVRGTGTVIEFIEDVLSWLGSVFTGHEVEVTLSFTLNLGTIQLPGSLSDPPPPPPLLAGNLDGSQWTSASSGTLYLNVGAAGEGDRSKYREVSLRPITAEQYTITRLPSGAIRIAAFGKTEDYANVTRIEGNFGSDVDSVDFINIGALDVDVSGGAGDDAMSYNGTGTAILRGLAGDDNLTIQGTPHSGSALYGGDNNDTLFNATALSVALYGENGNDTLTGGTGNDATLDGGAGNDRITGRAGQDHVFGGAGSDTFTEQLADLVLGETFDGQGDLNDQLVIVGTASPQDFRLTEDSSGVTVHSYTAAVETGSVLVNTVEIISLSGQGGADDFTSTGELNLRGVTGVVMDLGRTGTPSAPLPDSALDEVTLNLSSGNDTLNLASFDKGIQGIWTSHFNYGILMGFASDGDAITVNAGSGNDTVTVGDTDNTNTFIGVNGFWADLTVNGGGDSDTLLVDDSEDGSTNNGTLTSSEITGLGMTGQITYGTVEAVTVNLGTGSDTFNVQSTSVPTTVNTGSGSAANTINVGSTAPTTTVNSIDGKLIVNGQSTGTDTLNVNDIGDGGANTGKVTGSTVTGLGMAGDDVSKGIEYSGVDILNINLGTGADTLNVQSTSTLTNVNTGTGSAANTVNVGSLAPAGGGTVNSIDGKLAVIGQSTGTESLNVDDAGDANPNVGTLTTTRLTGLGMAANDASKGIEYTGFTALDIDLGSGDDTLAVLSTHTGTTTISGNDGDDLFNVHAISGATTIDGGNEDETINVGSNAGGVDGTTNTNTGGTLDNIAAALVVNGNAPAASSDVLNVDDSADVSGDIGTLTSTSITGLFGPGGDITYGTIEYLNIWLGSGADTFTVASTHVSETNISANGGGDVLNIKTVAGTTTVNSGDGADTINVGSNAAGTFATPDTNTGGTVNSISALLTLNGSGTGAQRDLVTVDDTADLAANTGILTSTSLTGLGMGNANQSVVNAALGIRYSEIEDLRISLGSGADTFTINSTHNSATGGTTETTTVNTGSGSDLIDINNVSDTLTVNGQADGDTINVNGTGAGSNATLNGDGENDIFNVRAMNGNVNVNGGLGDDTVNVGSDAPAHPSLPTTAVGDLGAINGLLTVNGTSGDNDTLNVDDSDPLNTGKTGTLTNSTLRGLELEQGIDYFNIDDLNIWLATGNNTFNIDSTHAGKTTVNTAEGVDTININGASGLVTVNAEEDNDTVNVRATGLGSEVRINGQDGLDTINLSDASPALPAAYPAALPPPPAQLVGNIDNINGKVVINGGAEFDVVNVDDSRNTNAKAGTLTSTTLRGLAMEAGVDYAALEDFNLWLGTGADVLFIGSTHAGTTEVYAGDGNATTNQRDDTIGIKSTGGLTTIHGQAGNDFIEVNVDAPVLPQNAVFVPLQPITGFFVRTHLNGLGATLNLHGEGDSDQVTLNFAGQGAAIVNVYDNGAPDDGVDTLIINGADVVASVANQPNDTFLLRKDFVALLNGFNGTAFTQVERANYDTNINARLVVNGLGGNDKMVADDNSAITTLDGGDGNDTFQIGQVFGTPRTAAAGLAPGDTFDTTPIIIGLIKDPVTNAVIFDPTSFNPVTDTLSAATIAAINAAILYQATHGGDALDGVAYVSHGVTYATTVFGGDGNDVFNVYHNKGALRLEGEGDNDEFIVRAFVTLDLSGQGDTEVSGGAGSDTINYAINAPVSIDGGLGFDKVVVLGTPFNDSFVVSDEGIFGAGLNIKFTNVESAELDTLEGNDTIYVLGTSSEVVTTVIGGLGSDTVQVMGDVINTIISNDLLGSSGVITQGLTSADSNYNSVGVNGVAVNVLSGNTNGLVSIEPSGAPLLVSESGTIASYFIALVNPSLPALLANPVFLTISAGLASSEDRGLGGASVLVRIKNVGVFTNAVVLTFDNTNAATTFEIEVMAVDDPAAEGPRVALISHSIISGNPAYNGLALIDTFVNVIDNDQAGLDIRQTAGNTEVLEGPNGFNDTYTVALTKAPAAGEIVTVTLQTNTQLLPMVPLVFNAGNWSALQTVTVNATNDALDGVELATITHVIASTGGAYNSIAPADYPKLNVTVYDDETPGAIVRETGGSTIVVKNGAHDTYAVRLTSAPAANVVLTMRTDTQTKLTSAAPGFAVVDEVATDGIFQYTLTFTTANWFNWVTIDVQNNPAFAGAAHDAVKVFEPRDQNLDQIRGPLIVEGGVGSPQVPRALAAPVLLPGETNDPSIESSAQVNDSQGTDILNVFHTDNTDADTGNLSYRTMDAASHVLANPGLALTGFEMSGDKAVQTGTAAAPQTKYYGGGITYNGFEIVEVLLGKGNESLTVNDTGDRDEKASVSPDPAAITAIHGGGGADIINITNRGKGPLVVYGDTSEDGVRYSNNQPSASINGTSFNNPGGDTINAIAMPAKNDVFVGLVIYGGPGNDTITGSQGDDHIAGGGGQDTINGENGADHIYGDSHFNVNLQLFAQDQLSRFANNAPQIAAMFTVPTTGTDAATTLADIINGGPGNDVIFGDHGVIGQTAGIRRIESTGDLILLQTANVVNGGGDTIHGNTDNDFIFGGAGGDTIYGDVGRDLVFGDHGTVARNTGNIDANRIGTIDGAGVQNAVAVFTYTSDASPAADGSAGNDTIYGGSLAVLDTDTGKNILLGQQGSDTIYGGGSDDDIYGGHNVADGTDTGDFIDGAAGNDVIVGDNGQIEHTAAATDPRFALLQAGLIYNNQGLAQISPVIGTNPAGVEARRIVLFDHDDSANNIGNFGNDKIAGGADDDVIFGELGDDTLHGDGRLQSGALVTLMATVALSDPGGDDYMEGNGGSDTMYGGLGQDDMIGGSSSLYSLNAGSKRPDGADTIFGGNGDMVDRNSTGGAVVDSSGNVITNEAARHGRDSDAIVGDNGNILRLVGKNGIDEHHLLAFAYDNYAGDKIVVRAVVLLDYTPGGTDYSPAAAFDIGGADIIHGESGDDFIYGEKGSDVIFGDAQDDDIVAGYGNDWISAGTGDDGVIGDDGRIFTSRNGTAEPLNGVTATVQGFISTPGDFQQAVTDPTGVLKKSVDLTPFSQDPASNANYDEFNGVSKHTSDDIIYGGLGMDWLHGGSGDDAISGAEALSSFFNAPANAGNVLLFNPATGKFAAYDEYAPMTKIPGFLLNFAETEGPAVVNATWGTVNSDGDDKLFGDLGNDWLVGGTGRDDLYGGWGDDLMNADDKQSTHGDLNDQPDTHPNYEDRAYGGAGIDVLIGNTGGDRLIDWAGEFNSYIVPFSPFGLGTVSRTLEPQLAEFLYALGASDGADFTRAADTGGDPARKGEPRGELGVVRQQDFAWQDQTGAPRDVQPGNIPGGKRDVLRTADFDSGQTTTAGGFSTASGFSPDSGTWKIENGALQVSADSTRSDAVSVMPIGDVLPGYFELQASVLAIKPTAGWNANAFIIFDYQNEQDFKFAGIDVSLSKLVMGHRDASGWQVDEQAPVKGGLKSDTFYNMLVAVNGLNVTLVIDNQLVFTHTYQARVVDGYSYGLNWGLVGVGSNNARGTFDNIQVQVLPPQLTFDQTEDFVGPATLSFSAFTSGSWNISSGVYTGTPASPAGLSLLDLGPDNLGFSSYLEMNSKVTTASRSGFAFDRYADGSFKFAVIDVVTDQVIIGHYTTKSGWVNDAVVSKVTNAGTAYTLGVALKGTTVSVTLDGQTVLGYSFNASTVDGNFGLLTIGGPVTFDDVRVKTNDAAFLPAA